MHMVVTVPFDWRVESALRMDTYPISADIYLVSGFETSGFLSMTNML